MVQRQNIYAVIVTHNRQDLLQGCLQKVANQNRKVDRIVVVNNASTDFTDKVLEKFKKHHTNSTVLHLEENIGGSGGFHEGIKYAIEDGADWVWLMDDDTVPNRSALQELISHPCTAEPHTGLVCSHVVWTDKNPHQMNTPTLSADWSKRIEDGLIKIDASSFVCVLIRKEAICEVGLPYRDFFIWFDDAEYTNRIARKYNAFLIGKSICTHKTKGNKRDLLRDINKENSWKFYYGIRNRLFAKRMDNLGILFFVKTFFRDIKEIVMHSRNITYALSVYIKAFCDGLKYSEKIKYPNF